MSKVEKFDNEYLHFSDFIDIANFFGKKKEPGVCGTLRSTRWSGLIK